MRPSELVGRAYRKRSSGLGALNNGHDITVDLSDWPTPKPRVELDGDDYPYLKLALIDRHLDKEYET